MEYEIGAADKMRRIADQKVEAKDRSALLYMLDDPAGRWFMMRLFERCHLVNSRLFSEENVNRLLVMEGQRRVGLHIQNLITSDPATLAAKQKAESEYHAFMSEMDTLIKAAETKEEENL